jgi:hypothetical protein
MCYTTRGTLLVSKVYMKKLQHNSWNFISIKSVHETCCMLLSNLRFWRSDLCCMDRQQTLKRGGDSPEGPGPSNEVEARSRGVAPSSEAGVFAMRRLTLEWDGGSLRVVCTVCSVGHWGHWDMGLIHFLGCGRCGEWFCGYALILFRNGWFPRS